MRLNQCNAKTTWNLIRLAMNKKQDKSSTVANLTVNNCSISDPAVMANLFNEFFTSISSVIVDENISNEIPIFSFFDTPLSVKEVIDAAMQLQ